MEVGSAMLEQFGERPDLTGRPSKKLALLVLAGLSVVFLASAILKPSTGEYFTICGFKNFTGLPCPGCGLTHSFCALAKGDVSDAFSFNLLGPPLFVILVFVWIRSLSALLNRVGVVQLLDRAARRLDITRVLAISFAVYGLARIVYVLVYSSPSLHDSPLSQLIARFIR
jgi:hypothetical protein